ncbi:tumor necrosis factor receptor superfamily member 14-like [Megalobrama amblycephala]|uniref:tumor necrosis factor receptor superfamily member 14-like n=1 Tax=Megalobrama amblycephala TaxID=75352 RepID=UPI002013C5C5|nr:tumor necrosis factor receptor superfamily member 14-like [Megalobrama amblycephala]XP_048065006.1 tumor necrosis factor receptor superfamily member 14-like [Megalobrama amblycephala]
MQILLTIFFNVAITFAYIELGYCVCAHAEYEINGQCCPMCAPGNHVFWHCTVDTSTTCEPCSEFTYTDEPNGIEKCFPCSACDTAGLKTQKACTPLSDTVCEPVDGFFCVTQEKGSCRSAVKHSQCKPGEFIQQRGTESTDTVCGVCTNGTYSDGTFAACQPYTICQSMGRKQIKAGTMSSDARCEYFTPDLIGIITGVVIIVVVIIGVSLIQFIKHKVKRSSGTRFVQI